MTLEEAAAQIADREPIFHHPEFGTSRSDFEAMASADFWEVGASGQTYSRTAVLDVLEARHAGPVSETWGVTDFACRRLAADLYLATYELDQNGRRSRRSTIWRLDGEDWKIEYHQGTLISG